MATLSIGMPTVQDLLSGRFRDWQTKHCWHHSAISLLIPGQYTQLWRQALVRLTPSISSTLPRQIFGKINSLVKLS